MKFLEINVGTSINPNTGEQWWKADTKVSLGENENPDEVFKQLRDRVSGWLPNPVVSMTTVAPTGDLYFNVSKGKEERG